MEHLTKNTYNEKLILTLREISNNTEKEIKTKLDSYVNKFIDIGVAIFTAVTAGIIVNICAVNGWPWWDLIIAFAISLLLLGFAAFRFFKKILSRFDNESIRHESEVEIVKKFNTEIVQKVAEVNEAVSVAYGMSLKECQLLNIVVSLYNLNDMLNWIEENIQENTTENKPSIRKMADKISTKICSKKINIYALSSISYTLKGVDKKIEKLLNSDDWSKLEGYDLMQKDYGELSAKIKKFNDFVEKSA